MLSEFQDYLRCGQLEHGFVRVKCNGCRHEHLVAFSGKRRGFCPSCGARPLSRRLARRYRLDESLLEDYHVRGADNELIPLGSFVSLRHEIEPTERAQSSS